MDLWVEDEMFEEEYVKARRTARSQLMRRMSGENQGYDSTEEHGRSNDSDEPLPYLEPTEQTEDGYLGLMPPMQ